MSSPSAHRFRDELGAQIGLALPLVLQQAGLHLMGLVDTIMLGHFSADALAGGGVGNGLVFAISCIGMGMVLGLDALVPQAVGAGDAARARGLLRDGLRLAVIVGLPAMLLLILSPWLLTVAQVDDAVAEEARVFVWARSIGVVPFLLSVSFRSFLSAHGRTRPLIVAVVAGNLLNVALDWLLIFGDAGLVEIGLPRLGLPALGSIGAATATSIVLVLNLGVYALAAQALLAKAPPASPNREVRRIFTIGTPIGLQLFAEVGVFALAGVLAANIGRTPAAAHQVAIQLASFTFAFAVGLGTTAAVRVGHAVGRGSHREARTAGLASIFLGFALMSLGSVCFLALPGTLASWFTDDAEVVVSAVPLLQIAALFQLSDGAQAIATGALRGAGDTRATLIANVIGHYGIGLVISIILGFGLGLGAPGLWWGLSAGLTVTAIILVARFWRLSAHPIARA